MPSCGLYVAKLKFQDSTFDTSSVISPRDGYQIKLMQIDETQF